MDVDKWSTNLDPQNQDDLNALTITGRLLAKLLCYRQYKYQDIKLWQALKEDIGRWNFCMFQTTNFKVR